MSDKVYCYPPDYTVLKNIPGYRDAEELKAFESEATKERMLQGPPNGKFGLSHLQAIHKHLFQDVYTWAGELRTTPLSKGGLSFMPQDRIGMAMSDVNNRLKAQNYLKDMNLEAYAKAAGQIMGDVNFTHPFREGNGRTQLQYLKQLTKQAGHEIDLSRLERRSWINASIEANKGEYAAMGKCIEQALGPERDRSNLDERTQALLNRYKDHAEKLAPSKTNDRDNDHER
jgi:cell filamentation protein, protein adenylyltransferase